MPTDAFPDSEIPARFALLFDGRRDAYGTGAGQWVRNPVTLVEYGRHLRGEGLGLGIAPMRDDQKVRFAAIDLDEADFDFAAEVANFLPGSAWIERSRSGNAHIWVFFDSPIEGWVPRGVMRSALEALGRKNVEVNPKQDRLPPGMLGNYLNLPYFGIDRPMLAETSGGMEFAPDFDANRATGYPVRAFIKIANRHLNDPEDWRRRARALGVISPEERPDTSEFGTRATPHPCAMYIYQRRESNPLRPGHRAKVLFALGKQLLNWKAITADRAIEMMLEVNGAGTDPAPEREVRRIAGTIISGRYTSTGCDDPLVRDYVRPDCPIRNAD